MLVENAAAEPAAGGLTRLARLAVRRRGRIVVAWVVLLAAVVALAPALGGEWTNDYSTAGSESKAAADRLAERFPGQSPDSVDVVWRADDARDPQVLAQVQSVVGGAAALPGIGDAPARDAFAISEDGRTGLARIPVSEANANDVPAATGERLLELREEATGAGLQLALGGQVVDAAQAPESSSAEMVGLAVAALVLAFTFGSLIAAGLPLVTALFSLGVSLGLVTIVAAVVDTPDWATQVAAMMGLGVGIDYALLIVTRVREGRASGLETRRAIEVALATAGRSVLVAGGTVVVALLGLFALGLDYLQGVALSAIVAVLMVMLASVTLLPALLGFAGDRLDRLRLPGRRGAPQAAGSGPTARWASLVARRPLALGAAAVVVLVVLALPITGFRLGYPDAGNDAADSSTRQAYELQAAGFGAGSNGPLLLVAETEGDGDRLAALRGAVAETEGVAGVAPPVVNEAGDTAILAVQPATSPQDEATADLVARLRDDVLPQAGLPVSVGGATAALVDESEATASRLPLFVGGVVGLSLLLLVAAFRAPLVALKAGVMNLASVAGAFGVVALVAEGGWAGELIGITTETPIPPFLPVMVFAIAFGLSMDYEVFLVSRIRERFDEHGDARRAVSEGLAGTARVIGAAAAIMVAVFGAFALSPEMFLKLIGVGLAAAILIDATIVRLVLVPAVMHGLGRRAWWSPRAVERLVPKLEA